MYSSVTLPQNWVKTRILAMVAPIFGGWMMARRRRPGGVTGGLKMPDERWDKIWDVAYRTRDRIEKWLAFHHLPEPRAAILETMELNPKPESFTFLASAGLLQESVRLPARVLSMNTGDSDLYAQCVADFLYRQLIRN
jgi:hypothetical protein